MSQLPFPERVLHQHIATLGKTGVGKSSAMRVIAEHLLDKNRRIAIVDPKGDWWQLAEKAGYSPIGGAFGNPVGALRTKGLLDYPRQGVVKAADWLFL